MRQFPVTAAMLIVLGGVLPLLMGGWLFLAGIVTSLPHLSLVLLAYGGCLLPFYGAIHWGFLACKPVIILPKGEGLRDRRAILLGGLAFLWGWLAMALGVLETVKLGLALEALGLLGLALLERLANRHGDLPPGYFGVRMTSSILCVIGLILALVSPQGQF